MNIELGRLLRLAKAVLYRIDGLRLSNLTPMKRFFRSLRDFVEEIVQPVVE